MILVVGNENVRQLHPLRVMRCVLDDLADASSEAPLMTVARILGQAPSEVLFNEVSLVVKLLRRAESREKDVAKLIFKALLRTNQGVFMSFWEGEQAIQKRKNRSGIAPAR